MLTNNSKSLLKTICGDDVLLPRGKLVHITKQKAKEIGFTNAYFIENTVIWKSLNNKSVFFRLDFTLSYNPDYKTYVNIYRHTIEEIEKLKYPSESILICTLSLKGTKVPVYRAKRSIGNYLELPDVYHYLTDFFTKNQFIDNEKTINNNERTFKGSRAEFV